MSRTGSFPLHVAYDLLKGHVKDPVLVFDPFCGKGTTLLAARMLGCPAYGIDIAPEAVICASAKLAHVTPEGLQRYLKQMRLGSPSLGGVPACVRTFFHRSTLTQILGIREKLMRDIDSSDEERRENAIFVLAALLGILHGHASYSLSISSAHAYSMAPAYVVKFAAKHGLKAPIRDIKACLAEKIIRCLSTALPRPVPSAVRRGSALDCGMIFPTLVGKVDLVLTSPPYLNAQTYAKDNWLRLWLLGYDYRTLQQDYIETGSVHRYEEYMAKVFKELYRMLKPGGRLICVAGDVRLHSNKAGHDGTGNFKTGTFLAQLCKSKEIGLELEKYEVHEVPSKNRYFHALSGSNGHSKRDLLERVFVAVKPQRPRI
jgi:SAM-dependent methyltransferase